MGRRGSPKGQQRANLPERLAAEIDTVVEKLGRADDLWLNDIVRRIAAQRSGFPTGNADRTAFDRTYNALVAEVRTKAGA